MDNEQIERFKEIIRQIESSGGKDVDHKTVTKEGLQQGQTAVGSYALMPNTIQEMARRMGNRSLASEPTDQLGQEVSQNPDLEEKIADFMTRRLLNKYGGDQEKAAWAWEMGHNRPTESITPDILDNSERIKKFRQIKESLENNQ